jgi:cob(I)alamin adenosyltransferase
MQMPNALAGAIRGPNPRNPSEPDPEQHPMMTSKLYTRTGDDGDTGLFGGPRVPKHDVRVAAYGTVDELNAHLGLVVGALDTSRALHKELQTMLGDIQARLFDLGADLATPADSQHADKIERIPAEDVSRLESHIDSVDDRNEPMEHFVLPGGTELAARIHVARTVCRRAERAVVELAGREQINAEIHRYLNRLSDLLFAMARLVNRDAGVPDVPWHPRRA